MVQGNTGLWAKLQERLREPEEEGRKMAQAQAGSTAKKGGSLRRKTSAAKRATEPGRGPSAKKGIQKPGHGPEGGRRAAPRRAAAGYRRALNEERGGEVRGNIEARLREASKIRDEIEKKIERGLKGRRRARR